MIHWAEKYAHFSQQTLDILVPSDVRQTKLHSAYPQEGGNRFDGLPHFMETLGYLYAEKKGDSLVIVEGISTSINGFFCS
ncbi:MAG: hypothetical protein WCI11_14820 [Candidatus Methylumidiphilus sp.]